MKLRSATQPENFSTCWLFVAFKRQMPYMSHHEVLNWLDSYTCRVLGFSSHFTLMVTQGHIFSFSGCCSETLQWCKGHWKFFQILDPYCWWILH